MDHKEKAGILFTIAGIFFLLGTLLWWCDKNLKSHEHAKEYCDARGYTMRMKLPLSFGDDAGWYCVDQPHKYEKVDEGIVHYFTGGK